MGKKVFFLTGLAAVLVICILVYYKPLSLLDTVSESGSISMTVTEYSLKDGEPDLATTECKDLSAAQNEAVLALLGSYPYRRTAGTLFSDGSMSGSWDKMLTVLASDDTGMDIIVITSTGKLVVDSKTYRMENADRLILQILEIVQPSD